MNGGDIRRSSVTVDEVARMACEGMLAFENGPVGAILGDATDPDLQKKIQIIKGETRGDAPVGATMPFDDPLMRGIFRTDHLIEERDIVLRTFLESPEMQTNRFGAMAFLRGPADLQQKADRLIPDSIIPPPEKEGDGSTVQGYSPVGNPKALAIVIKMRELGGISVMTSANPTGTPEIIYEEQLLLFAKSSGLPTIIRTREKNKPERPRSSYPISNIEYSRQQDRWVLNPIRTGWMALDILLSLHEGLPHEKITEPVTKHPKKVLNMSEAWAKQGSELRKWVLAPAMLDV